MNRRNAMLALAAVGAVTVPGRLLAQAPRMRRIGLLVPFAAERSRSRILFRERLHRLGWTEGVNLEIEVRSADNRLDRFPELVNELIARGVEVIIVSTTPGAQAAEKATSTIPIVFTLVADPVGSGLVASLARPGANVTGVSNLIVEIAPKQIELLKALVPNLERVSMLHTPAMGPVAGVMLAQLQKAATQASVALIRVDADKVEELESAFATAVQAQARGVIVPPAPLYFSEIKHIVQLAKKYRIATVFANRDQVAAGGLASYGVDFADAFARSAPYVDKILRGTKPADLPVEQADRFETAINRKTAAELGLKIPPEVLLRATEVIE